MSATNSQVLHQLGRVSSLTEDEQPPTGPKDVRGRFWTVLIKFAGFVGPGMMVSIAYIDPGNYSTDVSAGATKKYALLFIILLSSCLAMFLQALSIKLGSVTGGDLALNCKRYLPKWLNWCIYILAETAIIATDIAEVIGTAIALNILLHIPLMAGVILTALDVIIVLLAYRPGRGMKAVRRFEQFVILLLAAVVICFIVELSKIPPQPVGQIFRGFLPSNELISSDGLYLSCGILGATVMPHSLYLGSSLVKARIWHYDKSLGNISSDADYDQKGIYTPSLKAINHTLRYSIMEVLFALSTFALFVNCAILILAGAALYNQPGAANADLYSIYDMLRISLSKAAGIIFMLALLFSGQSAGIICTLAGQIVCEGHINWSIRPWLRRIITRTIAIIPCIVITAIVGKNGLSATLNASQVALSILLPFLTLPLIYLTNSRKVMTVQGHMQDYGDIRTIDMSNGWVMMILGWSIWSFITLLNLYLIIHLAIYGY